MFDKLKEWARQLKKETYALYFAYQDPRVPWYAKLLIIIVVAHTFSPVDLIPDFIPILGYLDDIMITPLGLALALRMIPADVMVEARIKAESEIIEEKQIGRFGLLFVVSIWIIGLLLLGYGVLRFLAGE